MVVPFYHRRPSFFIVYFYWGGSSAQSGFFVWRGGFLLEGKIHKASRPTANNSFLSLSIRCARPRGGGRGFRLPLPTLTTSPLALSRFLRRAAAGACKNRSAAPGCRYPNMRRGSQPACIFGRRPLLRLAASAAGSARLRSQRRLPVSSA